MQPCGNMTQKTLSLQTRLIAEEVEELMEATRLMAFNADNQRIRADCLKELADVTYVCYQLAASIGWDLDTALDRVHDSNMSKLEDGKPVKDKQGKIQKSKNYQPPSLLDLA